MRENQYLEFDECEVLGIMAVGAISRTDDAADAETWEEIALVMLRNLRLLYRHATTDYGPTLRVYPVWSPISAAADEIAERYNVRYRPLALGLHS